MIKFLAQWNTSRRMRTMVAVVSAALTFMMLFAPTLNAAFNKEINYQGKLTTTSGVAVADGTYNMEFKLYTVATAGTAIWTETRTGGDKVQVTNGLFSVMLGEVTSLAGVDFNQVLYLGVNIGGSGSPSWDGEMTPRKRLGAVPAAIEAENLGGAAASQYLRNDQAGTVSASAAGTLLTVTQSGAGNVLDLFSGASSVFTVLNSGNIGIGDTTPSALLTVGSGDLFQVNSSGAIAAATGITTSGSLTLSTAPSTSAGGYEILTRNTSTGVIEKVSSTTMPGGSGTANYVARWTGTNTLGVGVIQDNGTDVGIGAAPNASYKLNVNGDVKGNNFYAITTGGFLYDNNSGMVVRSTGVTELLGNTAIGTSTPFSSNTASASLWVGTSAGNNGNIVAGGGYATLGKTSAGSYGAVGTNFYLNSAGVLKRVAADAVALIDFSGGFVFKNAGVAAADSTISTTTLWTLNGSGHWVPGTNNTYDIGTVSAAARTVYAATNMIAPYFATDANQVNLAGTSSVAVNAGGAGSGYPGIGYNIDFGTSANTYNYRNTDTAFGILFGANNGTRMGFNVAASGTAASAITWTEAMSILTSGNVGINQITPLAKLDIKGDTSTYAGMAKIYLTDSNANAGSRNWSIGNGGSAYGNLTISVSAAKDGNAGDATATNIMVMQSNGNVGIGDTTPTSMFTVGSGDLFQVNSSGAIAAATGITTTGNVTLTTAPTTSAGTYTILTRNSTTGVVESVASTLMPTGSGTSGYVTRWTGTNTLGIGVIQDDGSNVGIGGAPNASYKLDVTGAGRFSGTLQLTNGTITTGTTSISYGSSNTLNAAGVVIGSSNTIVSGAGSGHIIIGNSNSTNAYTNGQIYDILIGSSLTNSSTYWGNIMLGNNTAATGSGQLLIGSNSVNVYNPISAVYIGHGARNLWQSGLDNSGNLGHGPSVSINPSQAANGTNLNGGNLTLNGGQGTGTGTPGNLVFATGTAGSSGTTLHTLTTRLTISPSSAAFTLPTSIAAGVLTSGSALTVTGTTPSTGYNYGVSFAITGAGSGDGTTGQHAFNANLAAGYTGSGYTAAGGFQNLSAGTGAGSTIGSQGNYGSYSQAYGTTAGTNVGGLFEGGLGNRNIGVIGVSNRTKNSATNVGVLGVAENAGTSPVVVGGMFMLGTTYPTFTSAALIADNGSTTHPIFLGRDNGTTVFTIADGGSITTTGTLTLTTAPTTSAGTYTILTRNSTTGVVESIASTAMPTGSGTSNYLARWTGTNTLGTGTIQDDGTYVGIGATPTSSYKLEVGGPVKVGATYTQTSGTYTGTFTIAHSANNQIRLTNSGIGVFLEAGPGNIVSTGDQLISSTARGALFSASLGGSALTTSVGDVKLNTSSGSTLIGTTTDNSAGKLQVAGHAVPSTDNTYNLGSASYRWANIYATNLAVTGLTQGSVTFAGASGALSQDNANFFWDDTNNRLGIGTATPVSKLHIATAPTASANYGTTSIGSGAFDGSTSGFFTGSASGTSLAVNEVSGYAGDLLSLQVGGVNRVKFAATGARIATETNGLRIQTSGAGAGGITFTGGSLSSNTIVVANTGFTMMVENQNYTSTYAFAITTAAGRGTATSGNQAHLDLTGGFAPTSGTATYSHLELNPTINQTGGANGVSRGIYINPILTAAADFRAIQIANNAGYGIYQSGASATNYFAGNVGIGTASPSQQLVVSSNVASSANTGINIINAHASGYSNLGFNSNNSQIIETNASFSNGLLTSSTFAQATNATGGIAIVAYNASGIIKFATGGLTVGGAGVGNERMRIDASGNVGIGDTTPTALFTVGSGDLFQVSSAGNLTLSTAPATSAGTYTILTRNSSTGVIESIASTAMPGGSGTTNYLARWTGTNTLGIGATYDNGTSVGIGTASPGSTLHVNGSQSSAANNTVTGSLFQINSSLYVRVRNATAGISGDTFSTQIMNGSGAGPMEIYTQDTANLVFGTNVTERMRINGSTGNVGIGTTTPSTFKLEVAGDVGPEADNTRTLGSSGKRWANAYATTVNATTVVTGSNQSITGSSGGNWDFTNSAGGGWYMNWIQNSATAMRLSTSNNLLIGTTTDNAAGRLQVAGHAVPATDNTYNLGSASYRWANIYATNLAVTGLTQGSVTFAGASGAISQDNSNFFWDDTTNILGVGTATPTIATGYTGGKGIHINDSTSNLPFLKITSTSVQNVVGADASAGYIGTASNHPLSITTNNTTKMTILASGNVGIGTASPATKLAVSLGADNGEGVRVNSSASNVYAGLGVDGSGTYYGAALYVAGTKRFNVDHNGATLIGSTYVNGDGPADGLAVEGNVGIGIASPTTKLHVVGTGLFTSLLSASQDASVGASIGIGGGTNVAAYINLQSSRGFVGYDGVDTALQGGTGKGIKFITNGATFGTGTTAMTILSGGNVGIGDTTPDRLFEIAGDTADTETHLLRLTSTDLAWSAGTKFGIEFTQSDTVVSRIYQEYDGTADLVFQGYSGAAAAEYMRIVQGGNVGIGDSTPTALFTVGSGDLFQVSSAGNLTLSTAPATSAGTYTILTRNSSTGVVESIASTAMPGGSGTTNYVARWTGTNTLGTGVIYDNGTNVGIATVSPAARLDVVPSTGTTAGSIGFRLATDSGNTAGANLYTYGSAYVGGSAFSVGANGVLLQTPAHFAINAAASSFIAFGQNTVEKMRIDTTGYVGIGSSSPQQELEVNGTIVAGNSTDGVDMGLVAGLATIRGINTTEASYNDLSIRAQAGTQLYLKTDGNVGIGTTAPGVELQVNGGDHTNPTLGSAVGGFALTGSNNLYGLYMGVSTNGDTWLQSQRNDVTTTAYNILLNPSGGNVGIGTLTPDIFALGSAYKTLTIAGTGAGTNSTGVLEIATIATDAAAYEVGTIDFVSANNTSGKRMSYIHSGAAGATAANRGGYLAFGVKANGTAGAAEAMRIDSTGYVGIGLTNPGSKLEVSGVSRFNSGASFSAINTGFASASGYSTGNWGVRLGATGSNGVIQVAQDSTAYPLALNPYGGNVGILDASPAALFTVGSGDLFQVNSSGAIAAATGITTTGALTLSTAPTTSAGTYAILTRNSSTGVVESIASTAMPTGSGTTSYVARWTGTNTLGTGVLYDNGTNVGIATTNPTLGKLQIDKASTYSTESSAGLYILSGATDSALAMGADAANDVSYIQSLQSGTSYLTRPLGINPNGGNVGIGTAGAAATLHVVDGGTSGYTTLNLNSRFTVTGDSVIRWGGSANNGILTWDSGIAYMGSQGGSALGIYSNGSEKVRIDTSGNMGIGTISPYDQLDVSKSASAGMGGRAVLTNSASAAVGNTASLGFKMNANFTSTYYSAQIQNINTNGGNDGRLGFFLYDGVGAGGTEKMSILSGGNVGIGTATPANLFTINQAGNTTDGTQNSYGMSLYNQAVINATLGSDASNVYLQTWASKPLVINSQGNNVLLNPTAGNVGIRSTSPSADLQVGSATFTGAYGSYNTTRTGLLVGEGAGESGLVSMQVSSTYNDATYPNYGLVLVNGASTSDYDTWGIMHDGPAKATGGLQFAFAAEGTNIHTVVPMVTFQKSGNVGIGDTTPTALFTVGSGDLFQVSSAGNVTLATAPTTSAGTYTILTRNSSTGVVESIASTAMPTGSGTSNYLARWTGTNTLGIGATYDDGTNVTIGSTSGNGRLTVRGTTSNSSAYAFEAANSSGNSMFLVRNDGQHSFFGSDLSEKVRITNTGALGVGTTSPQTPLHVYAGITGAGAERTTPLNVLTLESANTDNQEYSGFGQAIAFRGVTYNNSTVRTLGRIVHALNDESTNTTRGTSIAFETSDDAFVGGAPTEKMRIAYNGYVGIGTTNPLNKLQVGANGGGFSSNDFVASSANGSVAIHNNVGSAFVYANQRLDLLSAGNGMSILTSGNVGVGDTTPAALFTVGSGDLFQVSSAGNVTLATAPTTSAGTYTILTRNSSTGVVESIASTAMPGGSGTSNYLARWTGTNTLGIGATYDNGTNVGIGTNTPDRALVVNGNIGFAYGDGSSYNGVRLTGVATEYFNTITSTSGNVIHTFTGSAGATKMVITEGGAVGIGTSGPLAKLNVNTAAATPAGATPKGAIVISDTTNTGLVLDMGINTSSVTAGWIQSRHGSSAAYYDLALNPVGGNVGIGTSAPMAQLSNTNSTGGMSGSNSTGIAWKSTANDWATVIWGAPAAGAGYGLRTNTSGATTSDYPLWVSSGATGTNALMVVRGDGSVGIGTATPAQKLEVNGYMKFSSQSLQGVLLGGYGSLTETTSGASTILGNNVVAGATANTVKRHVSSGDAANFIKLNYSEGITFNTGIATTLNTDVADSTNERLRITTGGNVGVGDSSPSALFTVGSGDLFQVSSGGVVTLATVPTTSAGTYTLLTRNTSTGAVEKIASTTFPSGSGSSNYVTKWTGTNSVSTGVIYDNGSVGINTTAPNAQLTVNGSITIRPDDTSSVTAGGTGSIVFGEGSGGTIDAFNNNELVFGYAETSAAIAGNGYGSMTFGFASSSADITTNADGAVAYGNAQGSGSAIISDGPGSTAFGSVTSGASLNAVGAGSFAWGSAVSAGIINTAGDGSQAFGYASDDGSAIYTTGTGSLAFGTSYDVGTINSANDGSLAFGYAAGNGTIQSSGDGSLAGGHAVNGGGITTSNIGSFAFGSDLLGSISAQGIASLAFGSNVNATTNYSMAFGTNFTNSTADSFQVGYGAPALFVGGGSNYVGVGTISPAELFSVGTSSASNFKIASLGNVTGSVTVLNGSSTTSGGDTNSTTLVVASGTSFDVGNYVRVTSTSCGGTGVNTCYAKITAKATNTLTISPALTWANTSAVAEVNIPEIGGTNLTNTLANRFGRGYFVDGIAVGNGTTYYTDGGLTLNNRDTFSINSNQTTVGFEVNSSDDPVFSVLSDTGGSSVSLGLYDITGDSVFTAYDDANETGLDVMSYLGYSGFEILNTSGLNTLALYNPNGSGGGLVASMTPTEATLSTSINGLQVFEVVGNSTTSRMKLHDPGPDASWVQLQSNADVYSFIGTSNTTGEWKLGIANETPGYLLHVGSSSYTATDVAARFQTQNGTCDVDIANSGWVCSSDERLKKNITNLEDTILDQVLALRPVTYNWNNHEDTDPKYTGFIAQEVEEIFPNLVRTDEESGLKSLNYGGLLPYTIAAIQEMNIKVAAIPELEDPTLYEKVSTFLRGIAERGEAVADSVRTKKVQTEELCVGADDDQICLTKDQLQQLLQNGGSTGYSSGPSGGSPDPTPEPEAPTEETEGVVEEAPVEESAPEPEASEPESVPSEEAPAPATE